MNALLREAFDAIPADVKREFEISYLLAARLDAALKEKGITQKQFAQMLGKRDSEVSRWLTGRHNFTLRTIALIETRLSMNLIN
ncbi:MAG: helix-turn-helix transcriptional regulator [Muribaculaceae bacterium]|nr:helix-turn-helix transcriptional regulator [Muribaculaceae bacterium]